ncbi:MAG: glycosyltransferase family 39 protein [Desulfuromonadaceae bacterium]
MKSWLSNSWLRHPLAAPVLLVAVILAVYYPALLSGIHPVDDPGIFAYYSASPPLSNILLPGNGYYYRPIVELSFYLDNLLWGMEPSTMHLENILLHCANSLLVFLLACKILVNQDNKFFLIPLFVALLFALHPVNVEAVAWIAGRTDPLLALFVLLSCYFLLRWLDKPRWQDIAATLLTFVAALLTKETSVAFVAVMALLVITWPGAATIRQRTIAAGIVTVPPVLLVIFILILKSGSGGLNRFLSGTDLQVMHSLWQAIIALGFYAKKIIFPFPLNFAINEVHPLYGLLGLALFPFLWWVCRRYRLSGVLFTSAALLLLPAILVAVKQIAWTPFAERYLYLSTAFLALGLVGIAEAWQKKYQSAVVISTVVLLCGSALGSFQRNILWKDSLSFFEDTVAKSPDFGSVYHSLGGLLMQNGEIDRAAKAFVTADRLNKRDSMRYPIKASIMGIMLAKGELIEARTYFFQLFKVKKDASANFLEMLYKADSKRLETIEKKDKVPLANEVLETLGLLYLKKPDPFWLYRSGQIALVAENRDDAVDFFRRAHSAAPVDAHYKAAAKTNYLRLESGK